MATRNDFCVTTTCNDLRAARQQMRANPQMQLHTADRNTTGAGKTEKLKNEQNEQNKLIANLQEKTNHEHENALETEKQQDAVSAKTGRDDKGCGKTNCGC